MICNYNNNNLLLPGEIQAQYEREGFNMILGTADNQSENIIDGRFSMSMIEEDEDGFVSVEVGVTTRDDSGNG